MPFLVIVGRAIPSYGNDPFRQSTCRVSETFVVPKVQWLCTRWLAMASYFFLPKILQYPV